MTTLSRTGVVSTELERRHAESLIRALFGRVVILSVIGKHEPFEVIRLFREHLWSNLRYYARVC